ncbi:MAG TPA: methylated-DNA--[protein]-cysteine S-methyltransferase [Streptosporangiaceae bacterium]|nr:methylated-DNA--[protein]-cysteine S-methyltransferase [Streptosporangiaceae bacterium]
MRARTETPEFTQRVVASPIGPLTLVAAGGTLTGVYMDAQRHLPGTVARARPAGRDGPDAAPLAAAARELAEYFAGERTEFDLPLAMAGTDFQRRVWAALREIPYGETVSYGELARGIGKESASRAVGLANGKNPVAIIVPCHRVVGSDGSLTGYGGGLDRKRFLLALEQRVSGQTLA